jgi:excinuclease ABC subunit B
MTGSMRRAIDETERRRAKQIEHNAAHGITPKGVSKRIADVMRVGYEAIDSAVALKLAERSAECARMAPEKLAKLIAKLEKEMRQAAQNLEFEVAAKKRDELRKLREVSIGPRAA